MPTEMEHAVSLLEGINEKLSIISNNVLTKREQFIKDAPPVPEWFKTNIKGPEQPALWSNIEWSSEELKNKVALWHSEQNFDLEGEEGKAYQSTWEKYVEEKLAFDATNEESLFFAWRIYYADKMIEAIEKSNPKVTEL